MVDIRSSRLHFHGFGEHAFRFFFSIYFDLHNLFSKRIDVWRESALSVYQVLHVAFGKILALVCFVLPCGSKTLSHLISYEPRDTMLLRSQAFPSLMQGRIHEFLVGWRGPYCTRYVETVLQLINSTPRQFSVTVHHIP